ILIDTIDIKGNSFIKLKIVLVGAIHRRKLLILQKKFPVGDRIWLVWKLIRSIRSNIAYPTVLKQGGIEIDGLPGFSGIIAHKHQGRKYFLMHRTPGQHYLP